MLWRRFRYWFMGVCLRLAIVIVLLMLLQSVLSGCSAPPASGEGGSTPPAATLSFEQCRGLSDRARAAANAQDAPGSTVAGVWDETATVRLMGPSKAEDEFIRRAQQAGNDLLLVGVNGAGAPPRAGPIQYLDPSPGQDSENAKSARGALLACVPQLIPYGELAPTTPGSDIMAAVSHAARQHPHELLVHTDGISTAGVLDLVELGYDADPAAVVTSLKAHSALPDLRGIAVTVVGLGETTGKPLPEAARASLVALWKAVFEACGATKVTYESAIGEPLPQMDLPPRPADPMPTVEPITVTLPRALCVAIPAAALFPPDEAKLMVSPELMQLGQTLTAQRPQMIRVLGHAANLGGDAVSRQRLSQERAEAVAQFLRDQGLTARIEAQGLGASNPPSGRPSQDRRVDILAGPTSEIAGLTQCPAGPPPP